MPYEKLTMEDREKAHFADLRELLLRSGETVTPSGSEYQWLHEGQKITIRGNLWFHQYDRTGGDAISFVRRFYAMTYPEAVKLLVGMCLPSAEGIPKAKPPLLLPAKHSAMRRVYHYLTGKRGIGKEILDAFVDRGLIYESAIHHNAVFLGLDPEGRILHAHQRGTGGNYKNNAPGSDTKYSFHWTGTDDTVFLFEAPIDLLSYITLRPENWRDHSYAAACSVSDQVLWQYLRDGPKLKRVYTCFDNDPPGQEAAGKIAKRLDAKHIQNEILVPIHKDWNEDLLSEKEARVCKA